jgi:hypothetical protein
VIAGPGTSWQSGAQATANSYGQGFVFGLVTPALFFPNVPWPGLGTFGRRGDPAGTAGGAALRGPGPDQ